MKKLKVLFAACLCVGAINAQELNFTLKINAPGAKLSDKAYLCYRQDKKYVVDSVSITNGSCIIKGTVPAIQYAGIYIAKGNDDFLHKQSYIPSMPVYLEQGTVLVAWPENNRGVRVSGTPTNNDYQSYIDLIAPYMKKGREMQASFNDANSKKDTATMNNLQQEYEKLAAELKKTECDYIGNHPDSEFSLCWIEQNINISSNKDDAVVLFNKLSKRLQNTRNGKEFAARLTSTASIAIGKAAPDFTCKTLDGNSVSLHSFRGKYILLDFWASWCGPCRRENSNVVQAYNKYKSDKFDIIGFSLDHSGAAWNEAVKKDGLTWTQVSDLAGGISPIATSYGVTNIPSNFLLDPQGVIIAMNLRGEDLDNKLNELLK